MSDVPEQHKRDEHANKILHCNPKTIAIFLRRINYEIIGDKGAFN